MSKQKFSNYRDSVQIWVFKLSGQCPNMSFRNIGTKFTHKFSNYRDIVQIWVFKLSGPIQFTSFNHFRKIMNFRYITSHVLAIYSWLFRFLRKNQGRLEDHRNKTARNEHLTIIMERLLISKIRFSKDLMFSSVPFAFFYS